MEQMPLNEYLKHNRIVEIADETHDIIVSDWRDFLRFLYSNGYYVEEILWWEYRRISDCGKGESCLGGGGPIDPNNDDCFFGETMIEHEFSCNNTITDIEQYIDTTILAHKPHVLIPSFTVRHNTMGV